MNPMNPDPSPNPREEIEVRLTALLMGELSPEEAAALQTQMAGDAELTALHARLRLAVELLREASAMPEHPMPVPAQLSSERRERLLAHFKNPAPTPAPVSVKPRGDWQWTVPLGLAAALIALLGGTVLMNGFTMLKPMASPADYYAVVSNEAATRSDWAELPAALATYRAPAPDRLSRLYSASELKPSDPAASAPSLSAITTNNNAFPAPLPTAGKISLPAITASFDSHALRFAESAPPPAAPAPPARVTADRGAVALGGKTSVPAVPAAGPVPAPVALSDFGTEGGEPRVMGGRETPRQPATDALYAKESRSAGDFASRSKSPPTNHPGGPPTPQPGAKPAAAQPTILNNLGDVPDPAIDPTSAVALGVSAQPKPPITELAGMTDFFGRYATTDDLAPAQPATRGEASLWAFGSKTATEEQTVKLSRLKSNDARKADDKTNLGRTQFWSDDDSSKLNVNTAAEGTYWDVPGRLPVTQGVQNGTATLDLNGVVLSSGVPTKAGVGTLPLSGANAYTGGTTVSGGTFAYARDLGEMPLPALEVEAKLKQQAADGEEKAGEPLQQLAKQMAGDAKGAKANTELAVEEKLNEFVDELSVRSKPALRPTTAPMVELSVQDGFKNEDEAGAKDKAAAPVAALGFETESSARNRGFPERYLERNEPALAKKSDEVSDKKAIAGKPVEVAKLEQLKRKLELKEVREVDESAPIPAPPARVPQPEVATTANAFSTFSLNVSDVAFKLAGASLEKGEMPEPGGVRSEEFINAFDYRDPEPAPGAPLAFASERARYPFAQNRDLLRLSVKTAAAGRQPGRPLNLVLLLDNSGSMERADRVNIVREALRVLAAQLQPQDKLSVVTFARTPRLWADGVAGDKAAEATARVGEITPQGGTNLAAALDLGYATALRHYQAGGISRVVLLTDGAANLGDVNPDALKQKVEAHRKQGVALDCFGIGWEGLNDDLLEQLTRNGDGRYGFINTTEEAAVNFAGQLAGALRVAASDVKVQVEFNPRRVTAYRQVGYAKHQLTKEQFRDNTVDAAEIGAAESGNALYVVEVNPRGEGDLATVRVRFKVPGTSDYREHEWTVPFTASAQPLEQASSALRLAGTAGAFSEMLAASPYAAEVTSDHLLGLLNGVPAIYGADPRPKKLEWMIRQAKSLSSR